MGGGGGGGAMKRGLAGATARKPWATMSAIDPSVPYEQHAELTPRASTASTRQTRSRKSGACMGPFARTDTVAKTPSPSLSSPPFLLHSTTHTHLCIFRERRGNLCTEMRKPKDTNVSSTSPPPPPSPHHHLPRREDIVEGSATSRSSLPFIYTK